MTTPLSNKELREKIAIAIFNDTGYDDPTNSVNNVLQLIEQVCNESRKDELKQLWNYTQSDIVPEGAKPNDMSDRLHERIQTLTKESES